MDKGFIDSIVGHLTTISTMATIEEAANTRKLTKALISYLKYKTGRENQTVKLSEEIKYIKDLVYIYRVRNENLLELTISIDEGCTDIYIPHFTLMAFVENSLTHAFAELESKWLIDIKVDRKESYSIITISDNGTGFYGEQYLVINVDEKNTYGSIGSILQRVAEFYNERDLIDVRSVKGVGTSVIVKIPNL